MRAAPDPSRQGLRLRLALPVIAAIALAVAGCGTATDTAASQAPPARLIHVGGQVSVELSAAGAQRIQIATGVATAGQGGIYKGLTVVPTAALLYEPDGTTVVYTVTGQLTYTLQIVTVAFISGPLVLIKAGLAPGAQIVTTGAAELLGVQNGVGVQE